MLLLARHWWSFVLRGIFAILFGLLALFMPRMALLTLVYLFGFYALADGIFNVIGIFRPAEREQQPWWSLLIQGLLGIVAGLIALSVPGLTALALLYVIAAWAFVTGIMEIVTAIRLRKQITGEWTLILAGLLSVVFGILLAVFPGAGALAMVLWIGIFAIIFGVLRITLGLRLRHWLRTEEGHLPPDFGQMAPGH